MSSWRGSETACNMQINLNVWTHLVLHLIAPSKQRCALSGASLDGFAETRTVLDTPPQVYH